MFSKKHRGKNTHPGPAVHDDHMGRDLTASTPNQVWLAEITEHRTVDGKRNIFGSKKVFSNLIDRESIDAQMKSRIAVIP